MFNSMEDRVYHMFMYHDTVHGLWTALTQIWEELAQYEPLSDFLSDGAVESKRLDRRHTYQFLMGLKSEFETLRTQILNTSPLPSLYEAFAIVDGDERRRRLLPPLSLPESSPIVPDQRAFAASSGTQQLYCQHCRKPGHLIDRCWVLHPELKQQFSRPRGGGRGVVAVGSELQIAQLQSHLGLATTSQSSGPTAAIVANTPTALHGKSGHPTWILDSGTNNHMTGELATFTSPVTSVHQSVCIADGSSIPIRSQGDARLSSDITLSSDLTSKKIFGRGYERDGLYYFGDPLPSILTATYLINRTPSRVLQGKAPLHILQPASTLFPIIPRVFECTCFVHNRSPTRTKLDDKAVRCVFLGYSSMSKGSELLAADEPIPPRPLPILEPHSSLLLQMTHASQGVQCFKYLADGSVDRYKARLYAKGFTQIPGFRAQGEYLGNVCRLRKSIYGLKQSPRAWFHRFSEVILSMGFQQCHSDHTCFIRRQPQGRCIIISVYIDDIIITGDNASGIVQVKCGLRKAFDIKDLGPLRYFLGMLGCRPASTPMVPNLKISAESGELLPDPSIYQRLVGRLIYLTNTRPDLTFAVSIVSQFMHSPRTSHLDAVYHILRKKQSVVSRSSAEAEYRAMAQGTSEIIWLRSLLTELGFSVTDPSYLFCDNKSAIMLSSDSVLHERTKHIEVDIHFIREKVRSRVITPSFVPLSTQTADMFTKSIGPSLLKSSIVKLGLVDIFAPA
ncbi:hypothetical protein Acr_00g0019430 [Actinidia rufa]|uniref:Reverse transcriptase Ty1/copia-type domain-containing protein n=1 Tax=Actinidia rufa TaxID=165716 RepID=A0A7J0DDI6_9ERIC|nr:hypothetical protein Acr_00g0019430 [Actinidia rufa]